MNIEDLLWIGLVCAWIAAAVMTLGEAFAW